LDVLEVEKFPALGEQEWFDELRKSGKVILSPHVADGRLRVTVK
jgi:D-3-phosphoglycerate dehydrogenase